MMVDDGFDDAQQPRCEHCGTVMRDSVGGYSCSHCDLIVLRTAAGGRSSGETTAD
ncbi:hypothetical protein Q9S78_02080 [Microbacterium sp. KSW-18]|uniref:Uncharacterized protein n=1 Tax=Microbacterium aquilitoris TaxID=3067307 RepID=A0ABU3GFH2_9MICO|nr:hypothetical protein [Microbacterium sp. KSW-18]MDT3329447.1 hypothetical protein [Microbacterium sp. KSW-18]